MSRLGGPGRPAAPAMSLAFPGALREEPPQGGALSQPNNNSQPGPSGQLFLEPLTQLPCDSARPQAGMRKSQGGPWPGRSRQPGGRGQWGPRSRPGWQRSPPASGLLGASGPGLRTAPPPAATHCSLLHRQLLPPKLSMENLMSEFQCWQRMWLTFTSWGAMRPKGLGLDPPPGVPKHPGTTAPFPSLIPQCGPGPRLWGCRPSLSTTQCIPGWRCPSSWFTGVAGRAFVTGRVSGAGQPG